MPTRSRLAAFLLIGLALAAACVRTARAAEPPQWKLVWSDEFDGREIDRSKWDFDIGNGFYNYDSSQWIGGWGNGELQYYTREPDNAFVQDGRLHIRAIKESFQGCGYTSARLKTWKKDGSELFCRKYGRFEIRAKLPTGRGVWPALWMLPQDEKYGGWAASGEIDILEARGQDPSKIMGTLHFGGKWPTNTEASHTFALPSGGTIADFHDYALEWEPSEIRWFVDGQKFASQSFWWSSAKTSGSQGAKPTSEADLNPWPAPFDRPFYLILNVAVGGKFPGNPDKTTPFPAEMLIDHIRVYDNPAGYAPPAPRGPGKLPFDKP